MLTGYRSKYKSLLEWNWVPEELLFVQRTDSKLYIPNILHEIKPDDRILVVPNQAFVLFKDTDFIHSHSKMQLSIIDEQMNIVDLLKESLDFAFNKLNLNRIYGYLIEDKHEEQEILQSIGFLNEGSIPTHLYWNHTFHNRMILGLTKRDWSNNNE
ncbi:GNAT family protein [Virgibacillus sp. C22-A2]|uniref:GNAT family protein n=1 Tax=Virgibacillus tibetensis TaxID=3042313 RepID=A0ABU6KKM4_9BACI|nr:GNAT family protein [Virgibacillus sp. C22-A2]